MRSFWMVIAGATWLGCGDDAAGGSGGVGASSSEGGAGAGSPVGGAGGGPSTGGGGAGGGGAPAEAAFHLVGRYDARTSTASWSGSSVIATVNGPDVSVRLASVAGIWFEIVIDGVSTGRFVTTGGDGLYPLATGLSGGAHTVEIVRRNEGYFGTFSFVGFEPASAIVPSVYPYEHRIELIGDSLTCGYGIEGPDEFCNFSAATESAYGTYALVAARELDAAAHLICYSGKGVHQNYGGDTQEPMPELYPRTFTGEQAVLWDPADFPAEVVVVNLGTNDFSAPLDDAAFVADYVALLETARQRHPSAYLLGITWAHWGAANEALVEDAVAMFADANSGTLGFSIDPADGLGCDYHTNTVTNQKLGVLLSETLRDRLGW
jgi:hypothetical protein